MKKYTYQNKLKIEQSPFQKYSQTIEIEIEKDKLTLIYIFISVAEQSPNDGT